MVAVRTYAVTALLLLFGCSSGDILVKNDIGEEYKVEDTAVTSQDFPAKISINLLEKNIPELQAEWNKLIDKCNKKISDKNRCKHMFDDVFVDEMRTWKDLLKTLKTLPATKVVRFRVIATDVNNYKTVSNYMNVVCIPNGTLEERQKWGDAAESSMEYGTKDIDFRTDVGDDGSVAASVRKKVCEKYGQSS